MDVGGFVGLVVALFFGGAAIVYGGYVLEANRRMVAHFSYTFGAACMAAAITLAGFRIGWPVSMPPLFSSAKIPTVLVVIIILAFLFNGITQLLSWHGDSGHTQREIAQPSSPTESPAADVLVERIDFNYLPESPLNHGWTLGYKDNFPGAGAKWLVANDAPSPSPSSILIEIDDPNCAIDYRLSRNASLCDLLACDVKFT